MASRGGSNLVLGRYRILRKIGSGGMGTVFEAVDTVRDTAVALKTVVVEQLSDESRERLTREAEALRRFSHPNIVELHGVFTSKGRLVIVMEMVRGVSLSSEIERSWRLEKRALPVSFIENVALCVTSALVHAHSRSVLHRDVKPDNILVDESGRAVLSDFGLAKIKDMLSVTKAGQALGTVLYFAPEQMRGDSADERTDVYQLGLTLYETATGALPFAGANPLSGMRRRIREPVPPPASLNPALPGYLDRVVLKCLQPRAEARFQSMSDVEEALHTKADVEIPAFRSGVVSTVTGARAGGSGGCVSCGETPEKMEDIATSGGVTNDGLSLAGSGKKRLDGMETADSDGSGSPSGEAKALGDWLNTLVTTPLGLVLFGVVMALALFVLLWFSFF